MQKPCKPLSLLLILTAAAIIACDAGNHAVSITDEYFVNEPFFDDFNGDQIDTSVWQVATWPEHGGQTGTERCYASGGYLNLVFINDTTGGFLSSAIQTRDEYLYGRWETRLKPSAVPGILNSMYTIDWDDTSESGAYDDGTRQEIDIEFLTYTFGPADGEVHFAVHAENHTSFNTNPDVPLNFNPSDGFHTWGFEITPDHIRWFVDDTTLLTYYYDDWDVSIYAPYQLKFNAWSAANWINGPPAADTACIYQIDWIRFTPFDQL
jgi:endo-1,3-1,4-beta-glycanase ExoK